MHSSDTDYKVLPNTPGTHYLCQQRVSWMDWRTGTCRFSIEMRKGCAKVYNYTVIITAHQILFYMALEYATHERSKKFAISLSHDRPTSGGSREYLVSQ